MPSFLRWFDPDQNRDQRGAQSCSKRGRKNESIGGTDVDHGNLWKPDLYRIGRRDGRGRGDGGVLIR